MDTEIGQEESCCPKNEPTTSSNHYPIYDSPSICDAHDRASSTNVLFGMFPLDTAIYQSQPISVVPFQPDFDPQSTHRLINHTSTLPYALPHNDPLLFNHAQARLDHDHEHTSMRATIPNSNQMDLNYDSMIHYGSRNSIPPPQPSFSRAHEINHQISENPYPPPMYWNRAPTYLPGNNIPMISESFEIQSQRFLQSLSNPTPATSHHTNIQELPSPVAHHLFEPKIQPLDSELARAKRIESAHHEPSAHQNCQSAETSFSSSTDEGSTHELHLIETSMSSCDILEPPHCLSSPLTHSKHPNTSGSAAPHAPLRTFSPTQENLLPRPHTPYKKRARSATGEVTPITQMRSISYPSRPPSSQLDSVSAEIRPPTRNVLDGNQANQATFMPPPGPSTVTCSTPLEPLLLPFQSPPRINLQDSSQPNPPCQIGQKPIAAKRPRLPPRIKRPKKERRFLESPLARSSSETSTSCRPAPVYHSQSQNKTEDQIMPLRDNEGKGTLNDRPDSRSSINTGQGGEGKQERLGSLQKALGALETLTDYLEQQSQLKGTSSITFATPQHFLILVQWGVFTTFHGVFQNFPNWLKKAPSYHQS